MRSVPPNVWDPGPDVQGLEGENLKKRIFPFAPSPDIGKVTHAGSELKKSFIWKHTDDIVAILTLALTIGIPLASGVSLSNLLLPAFVVAAPLWLGFHYVKGDIQNTVTFLGEHGVQFILSQHDDKIIDFRQMAHLAQLPGEFDTAFSRLQWYDSDFEPKRNMEA